MFIVQAPGRPVCLIPGGEELLQPQPFVLGQVGVTSGVELAEDHVDERPVVGVMKLFFFVAQRTNTLAFCRRINYWRLDTQHNDIQHNDTLHNDIQHNDPLHYDIQYNDTLPEGHI
jgi:hypothetical protein